MRIPGQDSLPISLMMESYDREASVFHCFGEVGVALLSIVKVVGGPSTYMAV